MWGLLVMFVCVFSCLFIFLFVVFSFVFFFFNDTATTEIYTLSLHDALPIYLPLGLGLIRVAELASANPARDWHSPRSEEHTSELQSLRHLVCRLLLEKKKTIKTRCE